MAMTIKNERVLEKIRALATTLHTDQVSAVEQAVDSLTRQCSASAAERRLDHVLSLARTIRQSLPDGPVPCDHALYDEAGLPR